MSAKVLTLVSMAPPIKKTVDSVARDLLDIGLELEAIARTIRRHKGLFHERKLALLKVRLDWCMENWPAKNPAGKLT
jgi:hypothetical protein